MGACGSRLAALASGLLVADEMGGLRRLLFFCFAAGVFCAQKQGIFLLSLCLGCRIQLFKV